MTIGKVINCENISIQLKYAQYYTLIYNCTVKCYEHRNPRIENIMLSSLILLQNGFVFSVNIWISIFNCI